MPGGNKYAERRYEGKWLIARTLHESGEAIYTDEQREWLREIARFHARHRRYPSIAEALRLAVAMGYRQQR